MSKKILSSPVKKRLSNKTELFHLRRVAVLSHFLFSSADLSLRPDANRPGKNGYWPEIFCFLWVWGLGRPHDEEALRERTGPTTTKNLRRRKRGLYTEVREGWGRMVDFSLLGAKGKRITGNRLKRGDEKTKGYLC